MTAWLLVLVPLVLEALLWLGVLLFGREVLVMLKRYRAEIAAVLLGVLLALVLTWVVLQVFALDLTL